jgi:hypothetical protein
MVPLTNIIYGILGLSFIDHKSEGFNWVSRSKLYDAIKVLAQRYPEQFSGVYFTKRGNLEHSKQIEDVLFRLGGVLITQSLGGQQIGFKDNELSYVNQKLTKWLAPQDREIVKKLAAEFYQLI